MESTISCQFGEWINMSSKDTVERESGTAIFFPDPHSLVDPLTDVCISQIAKHSNVAGLWTLASSPCRLRPAFQCCTLKSEHGKGRGRVENRSTYCRFLKSPFTGEC